MEHRTSPDFWQCYDALPASIRELADRCYDLIRADLDHPSLHFKRIGKVWSARVGLHYRALAIDSEGGYLWFWIGTHAEYNRIVRRG